MIIKSILSGFSVKVITGLDDTLTRVPIFTSLTRTKRGKNMDDNIEELGDDDLDDDDMEFDED